MEEHDRIAEEGLQEADRIQDASDDLKQVLRAFKRQALHAKRLELNRESTPVEAGVNGIPGFRVRKRKRKHLAGR